jgi:hypothetical protein
MRSEVIYRASETIANRYKLCQTVAKTVRLLNISSRDTQGTIKQAFERVAALSDNRLLPLL